MKLPSLKTAFVAAAAALTMTSCSYDFYRTSRPRHQPNVIIVPVSPGPVYRPVYRPAPRRYYDPRRDQRHHYPNHYPQQHRRGRH